MTDTRKRTLCWLLAALMTAALMLFVLLYTDIRFDVNDDPTIQRSFLGYETGEPAAFHIYIHGLLAWPLHWLGVLFPGKPWFACMQLALLALSCTVMAKSVMQCFVQYGKSLLAGAAVSAAFLIAFCMKYLIFITFTQTSAFLGAAAAAQLLSIDPKGKARRVITGTAGSLALVCLSYALRQESLLPVTAFCAIAFASLLAAGGARLVRPMAVSLAVIVLAFAGMLGWRALELHAHGAQAYAAYDESRREVMDYIGIQNVDEEAFEKAGWDDATVSMAAEWCFLDPDITEESFRILAEHTRSRDPRTLTEKLEEAWKLELKTLRQSRLDMRCYGVMLSAALCCMALAALKRDLRLFLSLPAFAGLSAVLIFCLAWMGRIPVRALVVASLPGAAACLCLLPGCLPQKRALAALCCAALVAACGWSFRKTIPFLPVGEEAHQPTVLSELEAYALSEPESLFLFDNSIGNDDRNAFPSYSDGVPSNVCSWGGWEMKSPDNLRQFERFGIDLMHFSPQDLQNGRVYLASAQAEPPAVLLSWLRSRTGADVHYEKHAEFGAVTIFRFD